MLSALSKFETVAATPWFGALLEEAAKGFVLLSLALLVAVCLRRASAASRHLVWTVAVCGLLLLPLTARLLPSLELEIPFVDRPAARTAVATASLFVEPERSESAVLVGRATAANDGGAIDASVAPVRTGGTKAEKTRRDDDMAGALSSGPEAMSGVPPIQWALVTLGVWIGGVLFGLGRLAVGTARLRWLERGTERVSDPAIVDRTRRIARRLGLRRDPVLLRGRPDSIPMTWGARRSVVILPEGAEGWEPWRLDAVLTHELGHVVRRDYLVQMVAHVACSLHWFNPLAWIAANRLRIEREHACDDLVLRLGHEPSTYAHELVDLARSLQATPPAAVVGVCFARKNRLRARLIALMDHTRDRRPLSRRAVVASVTATLAVALPLGALSARAADAARVDAQETDAIDPLIESLARDPGRSGPPIRSPEPVGPEIAGVDEAVSARIVEQALPSVVPGTHSPLTLEVEWATLDAGSARPTLRPLVPATRPQEAQVLCGPSDGEAENHVHRTSNDDISIDLEYGECRSEVRIRGDIEFSEDFRDVARLSRGASLRFEVRRPGDRRRLEIDPGNGGAPEYDWRIDGDRQPFDQAARRWLAGALLDLFRTSSYMAEERVAWIQSREGTDGVLAEVERMWSDHAQGRYLRFLIEDRSLSSSEVSRVMSVASREIESDHALGQVLQSAAETHAFDAQTRASFIAAAATIESDHQHGQVLSIALRRGDLTQENLEALLESAAEGIESDHQMGQILVGLAERYTLEPGLRAPFLRAAGTIESDHQKGQVYQLLLRQRGLGAAELAAVLEAASSIESDHMLSQVLIDATAHDLGDATLREAFIAASRSIESDHSRGSVLSAALDLDGLTDADLAAILASAADIDSDHTLSSLLLEVAARRPSGSALRSAYLEAAASVESDHSRTQALLAFVDLDLADAHLVGSLEIARLIDSDHNLGAVLIAIAGAYSIEGDVREAFMRALDTIDSEHTHGRVSSAIVRGG
ncbi:MAG: M56 family metallopeptidase [Gemmatimonadetes bacterium]|nr:M56 family metallopeptidase [Gemmatimonadota bacterium]